MHHFKNDPEWGKLLNRFRQGEATLDDINMINTRVVSPQLVFPDDMRYATYFNCKRDAINAALFEQCCNDLKIAGLPLDDSILILSDNYQIKNGTNIYKEFTNAKKIWQECGEDDGKVTVYQPKDRSSTMLI